MKANSALFRLGKTPNCVAALAGLALAFSATAWGSLVVYEGFNYAGQSDNAALNGAAFNGGIGLSGAWAGAGRYRTTGLVFSDLAVAGGAGENSNSEIYYRKLDVSKTGTLWGSYLFKSISAVDTSTDLSNLIVSKAANSGDYNINTNFAVSPKRYQGTGGDIRLGGNTTTPVSLSNSGGTAVTQGLTYLVLFKVENLIVSGGAVTSQTITSWILSEAQYDNFKSGGLTEAELNSPLQGAGATNVMQRTTLTDAQKASFSVNDFLTFQSNNVGNYVNDEIRFADGSLAEVSPSGAPAADIYAFGPGATVGPVVANAAAISWTVPYGTVLTNLAPTYTLSPGATCLPASGSAQNFTNPVHYIVKSSDFAVSGKTSDYTATVSVTPASSAKNIESFGPGAVISGTNISWSVPSGSDVTNLAPTYSVSTFAAGDALYPSSTARNFSTPQTYTITAQDTSTRIYTVTVSVVPSESSLVWNLAGGGAWDLSSVNWRGQNSGVTSIFYNSKNAIFNNVAGGSVTLASGIAPASTTVSAASGSYSFSGSLGGTGALIKSNGGVLNLDSPNTYTGGTVINAGVVACSLSNPSPLGAAGSVNVSVQSGATLSLNRNQFTGVLTLNGGKIATGNGWGDDAWNGSIILNTTSTVDVGGTDGRFLMNAVVSGPGGLIKLGPTSRPTPLNGANTFTGPVSVQAGALEVSSLNRIVGGTATSNLGAPTTVLGGTISLGAGGSGGTLVYSGTGETTDRVIKLAGTTASATIVQSGTGAGLATTRGVSGLLKFTSDVSAPGTAGVDNRKTLVLTHLNSENTGTNPGRGEISGSIGDSLVGTPGQLATSITKAGSRTWTLSGENTYSGATKVQSGALAFSRPNSLGSGSLDITAGAKVQLDYIGTRQISSLTFNGGAPQATGTYGSSSSVATIKDDSRFSGPGTVTIGSIASATSTTVARTTGTDPSSGGSAVTFTATVLGSSPTGNVLFYDGLTLIGSSALNSSFQATVTTSALTAAVHVISAQYVGNSSNATSAGNLTHTVTEARTLATTTTLAVTSGNNPSAFGAAVSFTATVTGSTPGGSVRFFDGTNSIGTVSLDGSGNAVLTVSNLKAGWHPISVRYLGDVTHLPSAPAAVLFQTVNPPAGNGKLKIFILAGQSNMQGKASAEIGRDPSNLSQTNFAGGLGSLRNMVNKSPDKYGYLVNPANPIANGSPGWITRADVGVTYFSDPGAGENRRGILDVNFGDTGTQGRIGPEYSFGLVVGSQLQDNVLLIKYAFGGRSLAVDYRPPSAVAARGGVVGPYYTGMLARIDQVVKNLSTYYPAYTGGGSEIVGFGWHQGFNDRISTVFTAEYEANMTDLINDLRFTLKLPNLPVVIADTGMGNAPTGVGSLIAAQANVADPAKHPEFAGNVTTVKTTPFDYGNLLGGSNEGYHWNWNAESYFNIGESMGLAMMSMLPAPSSEKDILTFQIAGLPTATISGNNIGLTVPFGTDVSALVPTFTLSPFASASPVSGTPRNFASPQIYSIRAQDLSSRDYTVTVNIAASPFATWASNPAQGLTVGVNNGSLDDPDRDGVSNLMEFALGGAPLVSSQSILPVLAKVSSDWVFEYNRSDLSLPPATTQIVEYGSDLIGWTQVIVPTVSSATVSITEGSPSDRIKVIIPNQGSKVFVRLKVSQ